MQKINWIGEREVALITAMAEFKNEPDFSDEQQEMYIKGWLAAKRNTASATERAATQPAGEVLYAIIYDDHDKRPVIVQGEQAARAWFARIGNQGFNAHLFAKLESNSRDDPNYSRNLAAPISEATAPTVPRWVEDKAIAAQADSSSAAPSDELTTALRKAFITLESNGNNDGGRNLILKFNHREDSYVVRDFLLKTIAAPAPTVAAPSEPMVTITAKALDAINLALADALAAPTGASQSAGSIRFENKFQKLMNAYLDAVAKNGDAFKEGDALCAYIDSRPRSEDSRAKFTEEAAMVASAWGAPASAINAIRALASTTPQKADDE